MPNLRTRAVTAVAAIALPAAASAERIPLKCSVEVTRVTLGEGETPETRTRRDDYYILDDEGRVILAPADDGSGFRSACGLPGCEWTYDGRTVGFKSEFRFGTAMRTTETLKIDRVSGKLVGTFLGETFSNLKLVSEEVVLTGGTCMRQPNENALKPKF